MRFLGSSLDPEQLTVTRRWFGLHLVVHFMSKPERILQMYGPDGTGESAIASLLRIPGRRGRLADRLERARFRI
jgi:hypothetical protein